MRSILSIVVLLTVSGFMVEATNDGTHIDRGLSDIWDTIKNTLKNALNSIKNFAEKTKVKINKWVEDLKDRAKDLADKFKEKVKNMREKSRQIIKDLVGTEAAQKIKACFEKETDVEALLRQLIQNVTVCISENILHLKHLGQNVSRNYDINETELLVELEISLKKCIAANDTEFCLNEAKRDVFNYTNNMEKEILNQGVISRGIVDDLLDKAVSCAYEGLIKATKIIAVETLRVVACVAKK